MSLTWNSMFYINIPTLSPSPLPTEQSKSIMKNVLTRIEGGTIKLSGFTEILKVKAAEAKLPFPVRHDWDSYFRDSKDMNEMVPGELFLSCA